MARLAKAKRKKAAEQAPTERPNKVKVTLTVNEGTPVHYMNYAEVNITAHDFTLTGGRIPSKPDRAAVEAALASGTMAIESDFQIIIPTNVIPGLIRALITQKESYERQVGPIFDAGAQNE